MNYMLKEKRGQDAYGFVELFVDDEPKGRRTAAIVNYLAAGFNEHPFPRIAVTLLTELKPEKITDGLFHDFFNDLLDQQIKQNAQNYFNDSTKISYLDTVTLHISDIDGLTVFTNGDFGII
ncbi:MAG: hypothetical protein J5374_10645 [Bacteroidales bacterium]|nr:hypothetical protein [Bacteroidales bacterium]